jgi:hypothetical protein
MTTHVCRVAGSDDPTTTKQMSFQHFTLLQFSDRSCSLDPLPRQEPEVAPARIESPTPSYRASALIAESKRRMSSLRSKSDKKFGTILRAVPETTICAEAVLHDQRDTTVDTCPDVSNRGLDTPDRLTPLLSIGPEVTQFRSQSRNSSIISPIKASPVDELRSVLSNASLKGAIGIYKHGKIQWRQKDNAHAESGIKNRHSTDRRSKPKIHVVIPGGRQRPLPATPNLGDPSQRHIITASYQSLVMHDVSPPSSSTNPITRNSVVSPLNQTQPVSFGQFQRSMSRVIRKTAVRPSREDLPASKPSNSSIESLDSDSISAYSTRSSETSIEAEAPPSETKRIRYHSGVNPIDAGVFESSPESYTKPPSSLPPRKYTPHPHVEQDSVFQPTCSIQRPRNASGTLSRQPTLKSPNRPNRRRSLATTNGVIDGAISRSTSRQLSSPRQRRSPTLSEAENDLEDHLTSLAEVVDPTASRGEEPDTPASTNGSYLDWHERLEQQASREVLGQPRKDSATVERTVTPAPFVPRKSSQRHSGANTESFRLSRVPDSHIASQIERSFARGRSPRLTISIPDFKRATAAPEHSSISNESQQAKRTITPTCAELVILAIFRSLDHFDDLFATAVVNRGFYRVFKRHELDLIKSTLRKMSPPAWEFREIAFPGHDMLHDEDLEMTRPQEEYVPASYIMLQKQDIATIKAIKSLIKDKCESFVRPEIAAALVSDDSEDTARIDDALWRIWTFCKIFGSGKGREEDIVAQQDWLQGGLIVHQKTCTFSVMSTDYMNDTLVGAPECFAKGNEGGLSAEQLFDMMELWNCLGVLLQGFETAQAREYGIYDNTDVGGGDIDGEESMLGMYLDMQYQIIC